MLIDCSYCQSRVNGDLIAEGREPVCDDDYPTDTKIVFLKCPNCSNSLLGRSEFCQVSASEYDWGDAWRLWPEPQNYLHRSIPEDVRSSLNEAQICHHAKAYSACAVMCGRAIEAIGVAHNSENTSLYKGLQALRESGVIDARLFDWGESLRKERNTGAHATGQKVTPEDASDVLEFATAICEYVYVLSDRYDSYQKRKAEREK